MKKTLHITTHLTNSSKQPDKHLLYFSALNSSSKLEASLQHKLHHQQPTNLSLVPQDVSTGHLWWCVSEKKRPYPPVITGIFRNITAFPAKNHANRTNRTDSNHIALGP